MAERVAQNFEDGGGFIALRSPDATGFSARLPDFSTNDYDSSANDLDDDRFLSAGALTQIMESQPRTFLERRLPDLGIAIKSILAFWILYMVLITIRGVVIELPGFWDLMQRRALATIVGAFLTFLVYLALRPMAMAIQASSMRTWAQRQIITGTLPRKTARVGSSSARARKEPPTR